MAGKIYLSYINTPIGDMIAVSDMDYILMLEFADNSNMRAKLAPIIGDSPVMEEKSELIENLEEELESYFKGELQKFESPIHLIGSEFQTKVWSELLKIPYGQTISYKEEARRLCDANASRAVASANGANRLAIIVPCHRVIASDGSLSGYDGGIDRKKFLLELEGVI